MWLEKNHHLICLVAALCCRCVTLLGSFWQTPPCIRSSAGPWLSPSGCGVPCASASGSAGWEESPASPSVVGVGSGWAGMWRKPKANLPCAHHPQVNNSPPVTFQETWPPSVSRGQQKHLAGESKQAQQQSSWETLAAGSLPFAWSSLHSCELLRPCFIS